MSIVYNVVMSGHSKWANIKRKKEANDAKKGKVFSKFSRLIMSCARQGGGDVDANPALREAVERAKQARMPKENIEKAISKGAGTLEGEHYEEVVYEGYGPFGVAFLVKVLTDNRNRTVAEIRGIFTRHGGSLAEAGSTLYIFSVDPENPSYNVEIESEGDARKLMDLIDALEDQDDVQSVYANFVVAGQVSEAL